MSEMNYRHGHHEVEARKHDGTDESAEALASWIREYGGTVDVVRKGTFDYDLDNAYLRLFDRFDRFVQPNFWVVRTEDNHFYSVYPAIFKNVYRALEVVRGDSEEKADAR